VRLQEHTNPRRAASAALYLRRGFGYEQKLHPSSMRINFFESAFRHTLDAMTVKRQRTEDRRIKLRAAKRAKGN
jgi:hypothetical protein